MATSVLVGPEVAAGSRLLQELDRIGLPITAAFWVPARAGHGRRLIIASPLVTAEGSLPAYQRVSAALHNLPDLPLSRWDVMVVGKDDPVTQELQEAMSPTFVPDNFLVHLPGYVSNAPYLEEGADDVEVYVHRLTPRGTNSRERS
jgi:hypothetical protein